MKQLIVLFVSLVALSSPYLYGSSCNLKSDEDIHKALPDLESYIKKEMAAGEVSVVSLAIIAEGKIAYAKAFGEGATESTALQAGSISKVVSAFFSMKAFRDKNLDINSPLKNLVANPYPNQSNYLDQVTLKTVLNHTSGMGNKEWNDRKIYFEPGSSFSYSGGGYLYLQQVLEELTKKSYQSLMEGALLPSLSMKQSTFHFAVEQNPAVVHAGATLVSTPTDIAKLFIELANPEPANQEVVKAMLEPTIEVIKGHLSWGLGVGIYNCDDDRMLWHWGSNSVTGAYNSVALIYPANKIGVVIMTAGKRGQSLLKNIIKKSIGGNDYGYWDDVPVIF